MDFENDFKRPVNRRAQSSSAKLRPLSIEVNNTNMNSQRFDEIPELATSAPTQHVRFPSTSDSPISGRNSPIHQPNSSISSVPDERSTNSNRSSVIDPLTPSSDIMSPANYRPETYDEDQEFLLEDVTNAYFKQSDSGSDASGENDGFSTTDDDDEFGWKIKPDQSTKSDPNTPTSPDMPTIIPGRSQDNEQKSSSFDTVKDQGEDEDEGSSSDGQATWQTPPKAITDKIAQHNNASKQEKRRLQLIIPENNIITSEPQTTATTATSTSESGSPQFRSMTLSPTMISRKKLNRGSSIRDKRNEDALFRPNPEDLIDNLELYFPGHDLDRPIVQYGERNNDKKSPISNNQTNEEQQLTSPPLQSTKVKRTRTIRHVAQDHRKALDRARSFKQGDDGAQIRANDSKDSVIYEEPQDMKLSDVKNSNDNNDNNDNNDVDNLNKTMIEANSKNEMPVGLKRRSTVFWGNKVVQVVPGPHEKSEQGSKDLHSPVTDEPSTIKWVKGDLIGKGSFGHVYLALNANTGEPLAVKQVALTAHSEDNDGDDKLVDSIKYEIELLKDLDHDRIVSYLGFERTDKYFSIFLEYVPGGSVMRCLKRHGPFEENLIRFFMSQVLDGLVYLHERGVWHRDLKADNLLVDFEGNCKISDFGVSKAADADAYGTNAGATNMKGTFYWMAPEVIDSVGMTGYSAKCDIWSLGCVLLEMFTAERPWPKMTMVQIIMEVGQKRSAPPVKEGIELSDEAKSFKDLCFKA